MVYSGNFQSWSSVTEAFGVDTSAFNWHGSITSPNTAPKNEPEEVFLAAYDNEGYEGSAVVIYREGNKYYLVCGSHCSCYGLENQWEPEEYDLDTLIKVLELRPYWMYGREDEVIAKLNDIRDNRYQG